MAKKNRNKNRDQKRSDSTESSTDSVDARSDGAEGQDGSGDDGGDAGESPSGAASTSASEGGGGTDEASAAGDSSGADDAPAAPPAQTAPTAQVRAPVPEHLQPLVDRLRAGRVVLWTGSGFEAQSGGLGYAGLLERLLADLPHSDETREAKDLVARRPLAAAAFLRRRLGARLGEAVRSAAATTGPLSEELRALGELPFRAVVTTGVSDLCERAFTKDGAPPTVFTPLDAARLRKEGRGRYVLRALGDGGKSGRAESIVLTASDFAAALGDEAFASAVRDLYRTRSILFLGLDPLVDIELIFARLFNGSREEGVVHFAALSGLGAVERSELEATYGMSILDASDPLALVRALRDAVGEPGAALPDDDDLEGWIGLLQLEPGRIDALERIAALEDRLRASNDHERLLELHLGMHELEPHANGRAHRLREVGRLFETQFGDQSRAFTVYVESYKEAPDQADLVDELERLADATGSWAELLPEYASIVPVLPGFAQADQWLRIGRLWTDKVGNADQSLAAVESARRVEPTHKDLGEVQVRALRKGERFRDLADLLGALARTEESLGRRAELFLEQGDLLESRLNDPDGAIKAYHAAMDADPGAADAASALELLLRRRSDFPELVAVLDLKVKVVPPDQASELRREVASILAEKLSDRKGAILRYEAIRGDDPRDLETLRALERLYDTEGRHTEYLDVLAAQAEVVDSEHEKTSLYRRLAAEWEDHPGGMVRAAEYLEKLLAISPKSEEALRHVERLYEAQQKWEALVDAYTRHLALPGADTTPLQVAIARTLEDKLNDALRASDAWTEVLHLQPGNDAALSALARLAERRGDFLIALEYYDKRLELATVNADKVAILHEAGRLAYEKMGDPREAEQRFNRALELDPQHVASMTALVELYRKSGEFLRAAKLLTEAEALTTNRLEKTRLLVEAGELYAGVEEPDKAIEFYLKALAVDPEHVEAGGRAAELLWTAGRNADLVPILEMLTRKESDKATQRTRLLRLGKAARAVGQNDKAVKAYGRVAEIDPTDLESQRERGSLLFAESRWEEAREAFSAVLGHHRETLEDSQLVDLFFHLGECDRRLGNLPKAKNFYAKALEIDPTHRPTILAQIDVEGEGDPARVIESKKALVATASEEEKFTLLGEIGDLSIVQGDRDSALLAYRSAITLRPDARILLHKCLDVYVEQQSWPDALDVLSQLTELEKSPGVRAKLRFTRAMIHLDYLSETDEAIKLLNEALDEDPLLTRAATTLEELLSGREEWKELSRLYRKLIKRMPTDFEGDSPELRAERVRVWSAFADVSLEKLGEMATATAALEVLGSLDRGNLKRQEQLAELYTQAGPDSVDKAIAAHQTLLKAQHDRVASFRALRQLYAQARQPEKALSLAYALSVLKKGAPEDDAAVAEAKKRPMQRGKRGLDDEQWRLLAHPDEDRFLNALFSLLLTPLSIANGRQHKDLGINRKEKLENTDGRPFAAALRYVSGALNVTLPYEVFVKYEQRDPFSTLNALDAQNAPVSCLVVGSPMLGDKRPERELVFELSKRLAYYRADRYMKHVLPAASQLGLLIDSVLGLAAEADRDKAATGEAAKIAADLKRSLPQATLDQVIAFGRKLRSSGSRGDALAQAWLSATELTASRAALLLVGDLETTMRLVIGEPAAVSALPATTRLKELIYFSVTEESFTIRKHLGLMP